MSQAHHISFGERARRMARQLQAAATSKAIDSVPVALVDGEWWAKVWEGSAGRLVLETPGFVAFDWYLDPGHEIKYHYHTGATEILTMASGVVQDQITGELYQAGDCALMPPGKAHALAAVEPARYHVVFVGDMGIVKAGQ